ncbi:MAG TPA: ribonuclease III [Phycisphaerales bacterium]|nr:ribonuclease III [Phycisphaerales bacterium]
MEALMDSDTLRQIEQITGHTFSDTKHLELALMHSSAVDSRLASNERLEFLGDSILAAVVCEQLFRRFRKYLEGSLTKVKSMLVSRTTCAAVCQELGLDRFLVVGKGMTSRRALAGSLAAGMLEAVIGAVYLDGGFEAARAFILRGFGGRIADADAARAHGNFKSLLQQYTQERFGGTPTYVLMDEKGPDHNKCFESRVMIDSQNFTSAWGTNKKEAEQKAAYNALVELGVIEGSPDDQ